MPELTVDDLASIGDGNPANEISRALFSDGSVCLLMQRHLFALVQFAKPQPSHEPAHKVACPTCGSESGLTCVGLGPETIHVERLMNGLTADEGEGTT